MLISRVRAGPARLARLGTPNMRAVAIHHSSQLSRPEVRYQALQHNRRSEEDVPGVDCATRRDLPKRRSGSGILGRGGSADAQGGMDRVTHSTQSVLMSGQLGPVPEGVVEDPCYIQGDGAEGGDW